MKKKNVSMGQGGFTVIETTLFLAITAGLVTVAIIGTGTLVQSIRFSDSVRSTHAYVQSQYDEILNGVNPRSAATICEASSGEDIEPGASSCLLLGKLINFDIGTSSLQTHYVISTTIPNLSDPDIADLSDEELIAEVEPVVVKGEDRVEGFLIPWGATVFGSNRISDDQEVNTYALLRSPRSSRIVSYTFQLDRAELNDTGPLALSSGMLTGASVGNVTNFCIESLDAPDPPAMITVGRGQGQSAIGVQFELDDTAVAEQCEGDEVAAPDPPADDPIDPPADDPVDPPPAGGGDGGGEDEDEDGGGGDGDGGGGDTGGGGETCFVIFGTRFCF